MAKDYEKDESPSCVTERSPGKYMSQDDSFYGLVFKMLREEKPEGDKQNADRTILPDLTI
jgi:hypothetical protein